MKSYKSLAALTIASLYYSSDAFSFSSVSNNNSVILKQSQQPNRHVAVKKRNLSFILFADQEPNNEMENEQPVEQTNEEITQDVSESSSQDDGVQSLKDEIAALENTLKQKKLDLNRINNMADDFTKAGYARKVAQMESFRKSRNESIQGNKYTAVASVLQNFLPTLQELEAITASHQDDSFASGYSGLLGSYRGVFKDLGVVEFTPQEGANLDTLRMNVVAEEFSEAIPKGCVIQTLKTGLELEGNVMTFADVVVSLGSENVQETPSEEAPQEAMEAEQ
jgi:molecular chaperone GrpE (heat shock protein)